jgi:hypothetical protein
MAPSAWSKRRTNDEHVGGEALRSSSGRPTSHPRRARKPLRSRRGTGTPSQPLTGRVPLAPCFFFQDGTHIVCLTATMALLQPRRFASHSNGARPAAGRAVAQRQFRVGQRGGQSVCGAAADRGGHLPAARTAAAGLPGGCGGSRAPGNVSSIAAPDLAGIGERLRSLHHRRAERLPHGLPYRGTGLRECYAAVLDALERASQRAPEGVE